MLDVRFHKGVEIPRHGLWLDARTPRPLSFVSHAHHDHLAAHQEVILTEATSALMRARLGGKRHEHVLPYQLPFDIPGARLTLLPAGHIQGSAQLYLESESGSLLYTGDFKLRPSRSTPLCQGVHAETLVMETTFGLPKYRLPPVEEVERAVVEFCRETLEAKSTPVLWVYSLGKAQEVVWTLLEAGIRPMLHPAAFQMTEIYRTLEPRFPGGYLRWNAENAEGQVLIMPPGRASEAMLRKVSPRRTAVLTGWALDAATRFRYRADAAFPWSDHADYSELLQYVEKVGPKRVLTLHGFAAEFAADLRSRGVEAWAISEADQLELPLEMPRMVPGMGR